MTTRIDEDTPAIEVRPGLRYRTFFVGVVAAVAGTAFGIGLTIVSVVLPRKAELARSTSTSSRIQGVSVVNLLKAIDPTLNPIGQLENRPLNYGYGASTSSPKSFEGTFKVPRVSQLAVVNQLQAKLFAEIQGKGSAILISADNQTYGAKPGELNAYYSYEFLYPRGGGTIQIWAIGRGDDLTICVSMTER